MRGHIKFLDSKKYFLIPKSEKPKRGVLSRPPSTLAHRGARSTYVVGDTVAPSSKEKNEEKKDESPNPLVKKGTYLYACMYFSICIHKYLEVCVCIYEYVYMHMMKQRRMSQLILLLRKV
jgi:hypothetical protein